MRRKNINEVLKCCFLIDGPMKQPSILGSASGSMTSPQLCLIVAALLTATTWWTSGLAGWQQESLAQTSWRRRVTGRRLGGRCSDK